MMAEMCEQVRLSLLACMVATAISISMAFNIDTTNPDIYTGEQKDFFGYKVLQFMSGKEKSVLVTAPLRQNGSGAICRCAESQEPICVTPEAISLTDKMLPFKHFGLSIAEDSTRSQFTVCSPSLAHECYENSYLHSACFQFENLKDQLKEISRFTPAFAECTKKKVDLTFLFDGSGSMTGQEFAKNKQFISDIMDSLKNSSIKFAAVQFSTDPRKVFDFNDYDSGDALSKLWSERHMKDLTNTHKALKFVLDNIFESPQAGASPDAIKVLVIITDGDPSDRNYGIIEDYERRNIKRLVIGVKVQKATLDKLKLIASEPKDNNTFKIENYNGLTDVLENFEKKIFNIEGSKATLAENMTNEMSQSGFSATYHKDTLVLGSVGSSSWRGALYEHHKLPSAGRQIQDPIITADSYMGYSVSAGEKNNISLYFTGAPRYEHTGQVILFRQVSKKWTAAERIKGQQIGSYFGAELCAVDVDSDSNTDFLLVGAPLFHQEKKEGQIYVYRLTNKLELQLEMNISVPSRGRFGTTISSLADLNGDGLRDVAVGAPLEDNNKGAVYIYLGSKRTGIRETFSQRIMGEKINPELQFFGQSIDGNIDLGVDGLPDIVVGSQGSAVVLRSRPVLSVAARMRFEPAEISTDKINCVEKSDQTGLPMVTLTVCFHLTEATQRQTVEDTTLNISYSLVVDQMRQKNRGFFGDTEGDKTFTSTEELQSGLTCFNHSINMPKCMTDTLSPISITLKFSQEESESQTAVLNVDSVTQAAVEVPFEKNCRKNDTCIAELKVDFNFNTPTLLVVDQDYFDVTVMLANEGDDSYNTTLTLHYPPGLSFSMMMLVEATRSTLHSCKDEEGVTDHTTCGISLPVYRSRSTATFKSLFRIMSGYAWNDTMSMTITGKSDNENSTRGSLTKTIDVQFQINLAVKVNDESITYLNFTPEDSGPKRLVTIFEINNLGFKALPVDVTLHIPTKLDHNFEMHNYQVSVEQNKTQCQNTIDRTSEHCRSDKYKCKFIVCESFILDKYSTTKFTLSGDVAFKDLRQHAAKNAFLKQFTGDGAEVLFQSSIKVNYDKKRYVQASSKHETKDPSTSLFHQAKSDVRVEFIISPNEPLIIGTGAVGGFLLLIIIFLIMLKLGCFKRKTVEYYQEQEDRASDDTEAPPQYDTVMTSKLESQSQTDDKPVQPAEAKPLLDDGETAKECVPEEGSDKKPDNTPQADHYAKVI